MNISMENVKKAIFFNRLLIFFKFLNVIIPGAYDF